MSLQILIIFSHYIYLQDNIFGEKKHFLSLRDSWPQPQKQVYVTNYRNKIKKIVFGEKYYFWIVLEQQNDSPCK